MTVLPRMRTAQGVIDEIKALDPNTEITLTCIRKLIRQNVVPVVSVGNKKLVDVDQVLEYFTKGNTTPSESAAKLRRIRA